MYLGRIVELRRQGAAVRAAAPSVHAHAARRDSRHPHERPRAHAGAGRGAESARIRRRGCTFHPRCPHANERCRVERPALLRDATACASPATRSRKGGSERARHGAPRAARVRGSRRSPRNRSATDSRSRISQASPPATITSAARGRRVVVARHAHAVGAGGQHGEKSPGCDRERAVAAEPVAAIRTPGRRRRRSTARASRGAHGDDAHPGARTSPAASGRSSRRRRCRSSCSLAGLQVQHLGDAARRRCRPASGRART